jgi:hypothetical protein
MRNEIDTLLSSGLIGISIAELIKPTSDCVIKIGFADLKITDDKNNTVKILNSIQSTYNEKLPYTQWGFSIYEHVNYKLKEIVDMIAVDVENNLSEVIVKNKNK